MHLMIIKGHVILKSIFSQKKQKNNRFLYIRQAQSKRFLKLSKTIKTEQESYINLTE